MNDRALIWNTDTNLRVTSLSARLRELAGLPPHAGGVLHATDLWPSGQTDSIALIAHYWALAGETVWFEAVVAGRPLRFDLEPLTAPDGAITGVAGRATPLPVHTGIEATALAFGERAAGVGTWYEDLRTGQLTVSEGLAALLDIASDDAGALDIRAFDHPDDRESIAREIAALSETAGSYTHDHRIVRADGRARVVRERVRTLVDERRAAYARIGTLVDITDFKEREAQLQELVHYDALTRLPNRILLEERLQAAIRRARRTKTHCALLFIDLDNLKHVNDRYGHLVGDAVLRRIGDRLLHNVRSVDVVARFGGDEFAVLLEDLSSRAAAVDAAHKVLKTFGDPIDVDGNALRMGASIGVSIFPGDDSTAAAMLAAADREMLVVKRNGGYGVKVVASPASQEETQGRQVEFAACATPSFKASRRSGFRVNA